MEQREGGYILLSKSRPLPQSTSLATTGKSAHASDCHKTFLLRISLQQNLLDISHSSKQYFTKFVVRTICFSDTSLLQNVCLTSLATTKSLPGFSRSSKEYLTMSLIIFVCLISHYCAKFLPDISHYQITVSVWHLPLPQLIFHRDHRLICFTCPWLIDVLK